MKPLQIIHSKGPAASRDRLLRKEAEAFACRFINILRLALGERTNSFVIEVLRAVIRLSSKLIEEHGDAAWAQGILSGAQAELVPAWVAERSAAHVEADRLFAASEGREAA